MSNKGKKIGYFQKIDKIWYSKFCEPYFKKKHIQFELN